MTPHAKLIERARELGVYAGGLTKLPLDPNLVLPLLIDMAEQLEADERALRFYADEDIFKVIDLPAVAKQTLGE